jgi:hypothetical protein
MAAIIRVGPDAVWGTSTRMFRAVLRSIAAETSDKELIATLMEIHDEHLPGLWLPDLPDAQRSEVERIIRDRLITRTERELTATGEERDQIVDHVRELVDMLAASRS